MKVIAKQGTQCPKESRPRDYITDIEPCDVPDTTYYRRLIEDGSLITPPDPLFNKEGETKKERR